MAYAALDAYGKYEKCFLEDLYLPLNTLYLYKLVYPVFLMNALQCLTGKVDDKNYLAPVPCPGIVI